MQSITFDSCFYLKSYLNFDARAPSLPLLNFPFNGKLGLGGKIQKFDYANKPV